MQEKTHIRPNAIIKLPTKLFGCVVTGWRWLLNKPERLTAISTLFIFIATAVAVGVGIAQWRALQRTDEKIGAQLREMQIERQPFVYFDDWKFQTDPNSTEKQAVFRAYPQWRNSGDNPTYGLKFAVLCNKDGPEKFDYRPQGTIRRLLGPKQSAGGGRCEVTLTDIPNSNGIVGVMWIGGKATYFNSPRDPVLRVSEFCQGVPIVRASNPDGAELRMGMDGILICPGASNHNCADNECPPEDRQ